MSEISQTTGDRIESFINDLMPAHARELAASNPKWSQLLTQAKAGGVEPGRVVSALFDAAAGHGFHSPASPFQLVGRVIDQTERCGGDARRISLVVGATHGEITRSLQADEATLARYKSVTTPPNEMWKGIVADLETVVANQKLTLDILGRVFPDNIASRP